LMAFFQATKPNAPATENAVNNKNRKSKFENRK